MRQSAYLLIIKGGLMSDGLVRIVFDCEGFNSKRGLSVFERAPPKYHRKSRQKHPESRRIHNRAVPIGERAVNDLASLAFGYISEVGGNPDGGHQGMICIDLIFHRGRKR